MAAVWEQLARVSAVFEEIIATHHFERRAFDAITFSTNRMAIWVDGTEYHLTITRPKVQRTSPTATKQLYVSLPKEESP